MKHEDNPKSIKYHVKKFFVRHKALYKNKTIVDFPAGNGVTSRILHSIGARPISYDLFPEYFEQEGLTCERANINKGIGLPDGSVDGLICQEGIEHFTDQLSALKEFNRIIRPGGELIVTTPNYSNMKSKMSYLLSESERYNSIMAPNELDSIWMSKQDITNELYYGHIFLIGILKLRCLAKLAGFKIKHVQKTRTKFSSFLLYLLFIPFIYLSNWITYRKRMKKNEDFDDKIKRSVYREIFKLSTSRKVLTDAHLFVVFEKEKELTEVAQFLRSNHKEFGLT